MLNREATADYLGIFEGRDPKDDTMQPGHTRATVYSIQG